MSGSRSNGNSGPPRGKPGRPPQAGRTRAGPSHPKATSQVPADKRRLGAYTEELFDPVTLESLSDHANDFVFMNGLDGDWARRATIKEHERAVELFVDTLPMGMAFRFQTRWDQAGGRMFTDMIDIVNEEIVEREEASRTGRRFRPFPDEDFNGMAMPKLPQPVTWRRLLDQYLYFSEQFGVYASGHRYSDEESLAVDNFLCALPLNLRRRFRQTWDATGSGKWADMVDIVEREVERLRGSALPPESMALPRPLPSQNTTGPSQRPATAPEPVEQPRLGAYTQSLHEPVTLISLSDHVHDFVFENGLEEDWGTRATVKEHERAVELFLDTLPGEMAFRFQTEWDHIGGRTFNQIVDIANEEIENLEEAEDAGVEYAPPVSVGRKWMFPKVKAPYIAEGLASHLAGHACSPDYDDDEPQDERARQFEKWSRRNRHIILPLIDEFLFPLPVDLRRRFRREWEKSGSATFPGMARIAKSELRCLQKKASATQDTQAAASPTVAYTGIAIVTTTEQPTASHTASSRPQRQARDGESQRQRKPPSPPRDAAAQGSLAASMAGLGISSPPAEPTITRQASMPAQEHSTAHNIPSQQVHTGTGTRPSGSTTFFITTGGTHSVVKDRGLLINVKRLAIPVLLSHAYLTPDPEHMLCARHVGTLLFRRPGGPMDISIPNVYFCPDGEFNILGRNAISPDGLRFEKDAIVFHHTGLRFASNDNGLISFHLPHHGPGVHRPSKLRKDTAYMLSVGKYEWVDGQLVRAA
ncbi:uncharacterized protein LOC62_06G008040 [Vanrija pseudolonga]|uniref:Uncharacterized protein n=1 Tax=Vanrija pseudolonga TaxID=143232 RepID=A0AAF1BTA6_9TREE|nr:hypothetical protein LOC62_06G008040 [Vanrija pseudolonga]